MQAVTFADLKEDVREQADLPAFAASSFVSTSLVERWLNKATRQFIGLVMEAKGDEWNAAEDTTTTVPGTGAYPLPADLYQLRYIASLDNGNYAPMYPATQEATIYGRSNDLAPTPKVPDYRIVGGQLVLVPTPQQVFDVVVYYASTKIMFNTGGTPISTMTADTDYIDGVLGWEDWIVYDVCARIMSKQDEDPSRFQTLKAEIENRIEDQKFRRDRQPKATRETFAGRSGRWRGLPP